jgi:hypothetical protein
MLLCIGCTKTKDIQAAVSELDQVTDEVLEANVTPTGPIADVTSAQAPEVEETPEDMRKQFEGMTIQDMIDFYVSNKREIQVGKDKIQPGYFQFLSGESVQWYRDSSGYKFFPYLYIVDGNNLRVELFSYVGLGEEVTGRYCSTGKIYIDISTEELIEYYLLSRRSGTGIPATIETYVATRSFKVNITDGEVEKHGWQFKVLSDALVYETAAIHEEPLGTVYTGDMVKIIDMHYRDFNDRHPVAVRVEIEGLSGWVDVDSVDFFYEE